jgi:hypothetical protein
MSDERAEGFWWLSFRPYGQGGEEPSLGTTSGWCVLWLANGCHLYTRRPEAGGQHVTVTRHVIEWGPYLGKEPETIESLDRKIAEMMATRLPLFTDFDPSTDYEGEQTRAIDGAGVEAATGIKIVALEACPPEAVYMSTDREIVVIKLDKVHRT